MRREAAGVALLLLWLVACVAMLAAAARWILTS